MEQSRMNTDTLSSSAGWALMLAQDEIPVLGAPTADGAAGTATAPGRGVTPTAAAGGGGLGLMLPILAGLMIFMVVTQVMTGRKQKKEREALHSSLKRSDRVQTIGGVVGTVVELRDDVMVLRVHEASNTRVTFARSALQTILKSGRDGGEAEGDESAREGAGAAA